MTSTTWPLASSGPRGRGAFGLPVGASAADPAVVACRRAPSAVAVPARLRPGIRGTGVPGIDVSGVPAFAARAAGGYAGKHTGTEHNGTEHNGTEHNGTEHNGTTLGIHPPRRPSS